MRSDSSAKYKVFHSFYCICMTDMTQTCSKILGSPETPLLFPL